MKFSKTEPQKSAHRRWNSHYWWKHLATQKPRGEKKLKQVAGTCYWRVGGGAKLWPNRSLNITFVVWKFNEYVEMEETQKPELFPFQMRMIDPMLVPIFSSIHPWEGATFKWQWGHEGGTPKDNYLPVLCCDYAATATKPHVRGKMAPQPSRWGP